ncbi:MAG: hypothetical protein ACPG31_13345 [Planctomycetota bacterium]
MKKQGLAIGVGYLMWTVIWLAGGALFFKDASSHLSEGEMLTDPGTLAGMLFMSVVASLVGGVSAGRLTSDKKRALTVLSALLLLTGLAVQVNSWELMPVWYHLSFLILLAPMTFLGARFSGSGD